jgi:hypothetical protein
VCLPYVVMAILLFLLLIVIYSNNVLLITGVLNIEKILAIRS